MSRSAEFSLGRLRFEKETPPHPKGEEFDHLMASTVYAYDGDRIVGEVGYGPSYPTRQMLIQGLHVHPDYQGRGIGSHLMDRVMADTPADWTIYHGPQSEAARRWFAKYSRRPGFDPSRHEVAVRPAPAG